MALLARSGGQNKQRLSTSGRQFIKGAERWILATLIGVDNADVLGRESGETITDPAKLIAPMLARFMTTERGFARAQRTLNPVRFWPLRAIAKSQY